MKNNQNLSLLRIERFSVGLKEGILLNNHGKHPCFSWRKKNNMTNSLNLIKCRHLKKISGYLCLILKVSISNTYRKYTRFPPVWYKPKIHHPCYKKSRVVIKIYITALSGNLRMSYHTLFWKSSAIMT